MQCITRSLGNLLTNSILAQAYTLPIANFSTLHIPYSISQLPLILMSMGAAPRLKFVGSEAARIKAAARNKAAAAAAKQRHGCSRSRSRSQSPLWPDPGSEVQVSHAEAAAEAATAARETESSLMRLARVEAEVEAEVEEQHIVAEGSPALLDVRLGRCRWPVEP
jgi:hypothetical protein